MVVRLVIALAVLVEAGKCAKILGIVSTPSYSHQVVFQPLFKELSLRGHHVTLLTTDPVNDKTLVNLTEIDLHFSYKIWNEHIMRNVLIFNTNPIDAILDFYESTIEIQDEQLRHPSVQSLINGDESFDVMIIEAMMPALYGFAARFKCPYISMLSMEAPSDWYRMMGNPTHPVVYPDGLYPFDRRLTFLQRIAVVIITPLFSLFTTYIHSAQNELMKKYFGANYPHVSHIMSNPDMFFVNTDPIFYQVRPLVPTIIPIGGGFHMKPQKSLPPDIEKTLNESEDGFIYFSLGSNVKSNGIPLETRNAILETFSELPFTILWKFETENLPNKPKNVIVSSWFPQQDILRHPNIKLFITQGGVQSLEEATYSGVPILTMPFYGDQAANAKRMELRGVSLTIEYSTLTKEEFKKKILELVQNPRYRNRIQELANLARDQPMTGLERAVWWTEYVIRHNGTAHLRSPLLDIPWYQYLLLDVLAALVGIVVVGFYIFYVCVRFFFRCLKFSRKDDKKKIQ